MDVKNLVMAVVGMVIAAVMIGGALLPAVGSALDDERTVVNNPVGNSNYSVIKDASNEENHIITWTKGANVMLVDNNNVYVAPYNSYMVQSDKIAVNISTAGSIGYATVDNPSAVFNNDITQVTVTISGRTINLAADGTNPISVTVSDVSWYALPDMDGKYKLAQQPNSDNGVKFYFNSINQIYGYMNVNTNSIGFVTYGNGVATLPDGTNINMESNAVNVDGYTDLIEISQYKGFYLPTEYVTNSDGSAVSPYYMLIPTEILAHTEQQAVISALYEVIPIVAVVGLVMAGIYVFISRK